MQELEKECGIRTSLRVLFLGIGMVGASFVFAAASLAEDPMAVDAPIQRESVTEGEPTLPAKGKKSKGGKRTREKDAEGTQAPDRFEADTVIKSKYHLNGEPLEVDPD